MDKNIRSFIYHIDILEPETDGDGKGNYYVDGDMELVEWIEVLRKECGYTDFQSMDNEIYYNFYITFDFQKQDIRLIGVSNHTEEDDLVHYECDLTPEEKEYIMWLIIYEMSKLI